MHQAPCYRRPVSTPRHGSEHCHPPCKLIPSSTPPLFAIEVVVLSAPTKTQDHCARSQITAFHSTRLAYVAAESRMPAAAYEISSSSVQSLLRSHATPQWRQNQAAVVSFDPTPTQKSLSYEIEHPPAVGILDRMSAVRCCPLPFPCTHVGQFIVPPPTKALSLRSVLRRLARLLSTNGRICMSPVDR